MFCDWKIPKDSSYVGIVTVCPFFVKNPSVNQQPMRVSILEVLN